MPLRLDGGGGSSSLEESTSIGGDQELVVAICKLISITVGDEKKMIQKGAYLRLF